MSLIQVVDDFNEPIGSAPKSKVNDEGLSHRIVHILLFNKKGELLLHQRGKNLRYLPLHWCTSAGGYVDAGETYLIAASRELKEELGVDAALEEVASYLYYDEKRKTKKFTKLYKCVYNDSFNPSPHEVEKVEFFTLEKALELIEKNEKVHPELKRALDEYVKILK